MAADKMNEDEIIMEGGHEVWYYNKENLPKLVPGAKRTYPWGIEKRDYSKDPIKSPGKAIRAMCLQCLETSNDVKTCSDYSCPLYPFRFGRNPFYGRRMSKEQRKKAAERLRKARKEGDDVDRMEEYMDKGGPSCQGEQ